MDSSTHSPLLSEDQWQCLIDLISIRQVVPIIGPELSTVPDENSQSVPLRRLLAARLAAALKFPNPERYASISRVVCDHLLKKPPGNRQIVYTQLKLMLKDMQPSPPPLALTRLARISDFDLFICSSFDPLLALALEQNVPGFHRAHHVIDFHPNHARDLPDPLPCTLLFHILGSEHTNPDFAVWEDDEMEFVCGLIEHRQNLNNLFRQLKNRHLLFIGTPFTDWVVRFFLRTARNHQLSGPPRTEMAEYIAAPHDAMGEPMVFFFDKLVSTTTVINGDPTAFALELAARWQAKSTAGGSDADFMARMPEQLPRGFVFISYSHDDRAVAIRFARRLTEARIPVWLDKQRLQTGEHYEDRIRNTVNCCDFFISLISTATESNPDRYVHKERRWAAGRATPSYAFYIPVVIDGTETPKQEPAEVKKIHYYRAIEGEPNPEFINMLRKYLVDRQYNIDVRS